MNVDKLSEKFNTLFPTWTTVVSTILAVLILLLVLGKFVYGPVKKMVKDRRNYIQNNIDEAVKQNNNAALDREKANEELIKARAEIAEIISQAKLEAEKVRSDYITDAKNEAKKIVLNAQNEILREKELFNKESKAAIVKVALKAAEKVVEKEVDNKTNKKIINDYIKSTIKK